MEVHDVAELITWNIPRPEFYIQDILPKQGVMLLYGSPKVRKSWLTQYMAYCVSLGLECLGFRTEQARCFIAQFEISPLSYWWRLKDMGRHFQIPTGWLYEISPMLMYLDDDQNFNRFQGWVNDIQPSVIFLDCLAACFGGDENDGGDIAKFIEKINTLKQAHNSSVVLVHHTNKNLLGGAASSVDRARGHSRLAGWVDTLCYMAEQPTGVQLQIKARQATREIPHKNIQFDNYLWRLV